ncbi:alpha/beta hydrolase [Actinacidiphila sp. bgisy160]|uniref:alpha/beta hydrolase n=1 Tax=Actinacidiphila sp. bgisy160 TaxID=3413796 RepID=UPI003D721D89
MTFHTTHRRPPRARRRALAGAATVLSTAVAIGAVAGPVAAVAAPRPPAAAASATWAPAPADRGHLLSVTPLATHDRAALSRLLAGAGLPGDTVRYGVTAYRLTYRTVTPQGTPTTATGLFTLPRGGPHRLAVVSDTHGTLAYRHDAPSAADGWARSAAYLYASGGRAVVSPDYLGLGGGPGTHPYMDTRSAVTASVDMLRAARTAAARLDRPLTGDVLATGFSQGGQVAMALGRALHQGADRHFVLRALAPVSGPYDVSGTEVPALFDGRVQGYSGVFYTAYFLVAQNRLHPLYGSPSEAFRAPYDRVVEGLFDGEHEDEDVLRQLPGSVDELLTDRFTHRMRHPTGALRRAMAQADGTCDWRPDVPVRLYTASGDRDVPIGNSESCRDDLAAHDVRAVLADAGDTDHFGAFLRSAPRVARWFAAPARQRD